MAICEAESAAILDPVVVRKFGAKMARSNLRLPSQVIAKKCLIFIFEWVLTLFFDWLKPPVA